MIDIKQTKDCCGCGACVQRCPKQCILLEEDLEGFLYPVVDKTICIDCGLCEKVCPILNQNEPRKPLNVYAAKNKDEKIRMESSSGGIFTLLAEQIINDKGVVFGARFNEKWEVIHDYAETIEGLVPFRGSKYVQSRIGNTYQQAELFLKAGRKVLFSGTPCQIVGLKLFLRREYDNLLCVDFVCHGVPSPKVWRMYLEEIVNSQYNIGKRICSCFFNPPPKKKITGISFRDKRFGWRKFGFAVIGNSSILNTRKNPFLLFDIHYENPYMKGFLNNIYLRPSCSACVAKSGKSGADITLADFWSIIRCNPSFYDKYGVSAILVNSNKAFMAEEMDFEEVSYDQFLDGNKMLEESVLFSKKRATFFCLLESCSLIKLLQIITKEPLSLKLKNRIKNFLNTRLR